MERRTFLTAAGLLAAGAALPACGDRTDEEESALAASSLPSGEWSDVRSQFALDESWIHMSALLVSTHPRSVRQAIEEHRRRLDANPVRYLEEQNDPRKDEVREAAARYLGARAEDVALTDSTTMGIGIVYQGLDLVDGDEVVTTDHAYYATYEALRQVSERTGAQIRSIHLYDEASAVTADQIVDRIDAAITPSTRALALTWVHSSTGVKLPLRQIADAVDEHNRRRADDERVLVCVDGVHGFGVEDAEVDALGCDVLMAGCHKWLFGPRGTGIVWARPEAWRRLRPAIPSFIDDASWNAWATGSSPAGPTTAARMSPGGFKPFEHQWAVAEAFRFHEETGKSRVAQRTHALNRRLKEGLAQMDHVTLVTPMDEDLSAGITCFEVDGRSPDGVVSHLADRRIVASTTPYAVPLPRLTPSIYNTTQEIDTALDAIAELG